MLRSSLADREMLNHLITEEKREAENYIRRGGLKIESKGILKVNCVSFGV
jgi:hypothetical protein